MQTKQKKFSVSGAAGREERREKCSGGKAAAGEAVGLDEIISAASTLKKYKSAKQCLENRIVENENWFRLRHRAENPGGTSVSSAWLFNSIVNKHADFMDAVPQCTVLPREESDETAARQLTDMLPVILERNDWESVYSEGAYSKLKTGTAVYSVLWNPEACNNLGDIDVRRADILNLFWEPGVRDIQKSRNLFYTELVDNDILVDMYPSLEGKLGSAGETFGYLYDPSVDTSDKSTVVDWYYKKRVGGKAVLHFVKFVGQTVLYASENDPELCERGWYDHGLYPFVFDPLYAEEGTPVGFGFIDILKGVQEEIDLLGTEIVKNARAGARRRYFTRNEGAVNEEEFADLSKDFVHVSGSSLGEESIREISNVPLSGVYVTVLGNKINELKEVSGNRDFVSGGTLGGVTSGTAINALQEAGNKLSRDMISATYRAFAQICTVCIELIRQFYDVPRSMRILSPGGDGAYGSFDNSLLQPVSLGSSFGYDLGTRVPVFDVSVKAHKQNTFSRASQNNDALNFYKLGFFDPAKSIESLACMQLIDIDNKEKIIRIIEENGEKYGALAPTDGEVTEYDVCKP